jgi:hypothetical protein
MKHYVTYKENSQFHQNGNPILAKQTCFIKTGIPVLAKQTCFTKTRIPILVKNNLLFTF